MKPIKLAIASCNHGHAKGYYNPDPTLFELVAVSIAPKDHPKAFIEQLKGIQIYDNLKQMLDARPDIEAVVMASANYEHYDQFKTLTQYKKHILSMKVPTFDLEEYDQIINMVNKSKMVCQVELELRYSSELCRIRELICSKKLGKILSVQATNLSHNPMSWQEWHGIPEQSYGKRIPLRIGDKRFRGGALADHPHIFDIMRFVLNADFETVFAEVAPNIRPNMQEEDMLSIIGRMDNGIAFSLDPSFSRTENPLPVIGPGWEKYPKRVEVTLNIQGDKGSIIADIFAPNVYHTCTPAGNYVVNRTPNYEGAGSSLILNAFYDSIRKGMKPTVTLSEHRRTIEVINACYESIYKGKPVNF